MGAPIDLNKIMLLMVDRPLSITSFPLLDTMGNETSYEKHGSLDPSPPYAARAPQSGSKKTAMTLKAATPVPGGLIRVMLEFTLTQLNYALINPQDERLIFKIHLTTNQKVHVTLEAGTIQAKDEALDGRW